MLFQKDYWKLDDQELGAVALKYHIAAGTQQSGYDRKYAIECLLARDVALRTGVTVIATLVSLVTAAINIGVAIAARVGAP